MTHVIAGMGEVGKGLYEVLSEQELHKNVYGYDPKTTEWSHDALDEMKCDVLHVCFPFAEYFERNVLQYAVTFHPKIIIIHSTVEVGTTRKIINKASAEPDLRDIKFVHSPVRGKHPDIAPGLRTFTKYVGTESGGAYELAKKAMRRMHCEQLSSPEASELAKVLSLARYGLNISFAGEQDELCEKHGLTYSEVVQEWEMSYNEGLLIQGMTEYVRPLLTPPRGKIGGHCVVPGMKKAADESRLMKEALTVAGEDLDWEAKMVEDLEFVPFTEEVETDIDIGEDTKVWRFVNIMNGAKIGKNCVIGSYVEIGRNVKLGDDCKIEAGAYIPEGVLIGDRVFIGPNVVFTNDRYPRIDDEWKIEETVVEDGVSIGANSTVRCGVRIKSGALIGCGSVVTKDVGPGGIWYGNPARERKLFSPRNSGEEA